MSLSAAAAATALLLAACGGSDDGVETDVETLPEPSEESVDPSPEDESADEPGDPDAPAASDGPVDSDGPADSDGDLAAPDAGDPMDELPDPNAMVSDGTFRGEGIVLPAPDGWAFDQMALAQGLVLASDDAGLQQVAGQAIDVGSLPEPITLDDLVEQNRSGMDEEPSVDEAIELDGAVEARQLRYDALPPQQEGFPETSLVLLVADDGDGRLAIFNYAAAVDEFENDQAERLVEVAGFDPDSDPTPPQLPDTAPAPTG